MNMRMMLSAFQRSSQTVRDLQNQIASGRRVNHASDDPGAYESIRRLRSDDSHLNQYRRNADVAAHYLSSVDANLQQVSDIMHRANELTIRGGDATYSAADRRAMSGEVDQLLHSLLSIANASESGRHIFAGLRTDHPPYLAEDTTGDGFIDTITYEGSPETRQIKVGEQLYIETNIPGTSPTNENGIFQTASQNLFDNLIELRDKLAAGESTEETDLLDKFSSGLDHVLAIRSLNGARMEQVNFSKQIISELQTATKQSLEALESTDMAEALINLSQAETAYQAAMSVTSRMLNQQTLLNYI